LNCSEPYDEHSFSQLMEGGEHTETPLGENSNDPQDLEKNVKSVPSQEAVFEKFSLAESKLDKSCCNNFKAVFIKRANSYRRSKKRVFTEVLLPSAFLLFGVYIASVDFSFRSPSRLFTPELYPLKQKLLIN